MSIFKDSRSFLFDRDNECKLCNSTCSDDGGDTATDETSTSCTRICLVVLLILLEIHTARIGLAAVYDC